MKPHDSASVSNRGKNRVKPAGVSGASVFGFAPATAPSDMSAWKFEGKMSNAAVQVQSPNTTAAGATGWLRAF